MVGGRFGEGMIRDSRRGERRANHRQDDTTWPPVCIGPCLGERRARRVGNFRRLNDRCRNVRFNSPEVEFNNDDDGQRQLRRDGCVSLVLIFRSRNKKKTLS